MHRLHSCGWPPLRSSNAHKRGLEWERDHSEGDKRVFSGTKQGNWGVLKKWTLVLHWDTVLPVAFSPKTRESSSLGSHQLLIAPQLGFLDYLRYGGYDLWWVLRLWLLLHDNPFLLRVSCSWNTYCGRQCDHPEFTAVSLSLTFGKSWSKSDLISTTITLVCMLITHRLNRVEFWGSSFLHSPKQHSNVSVRWEHSIIRLSHYKYRRHQSIL